MAKAVMEAFPELPKLAFGTARRDVEKERHDLALQILQASGMRDYLNYTVTLKLEGPCKQYLMLLKLLSFLK